MIGAVMAKRQGRSVFDALNRRDLTKFMANWAEDAVYTFPGNVSISGETRGRKAIEAVHTKMMQHLPTIQFTIKDVFVSNIFALGATNSIVVEWDIAYANREGKKFRDSGMTTIKVKGGKAVSVCEYLFNTDALKEAWGKE